MSEKNVELYEELWEVEKASRVLHEYMRTSNIPLPEGFPTGQLTEICTSLAGLKNGSAEGCRVPLEYARLRLPAIRRDYISKTDDPDHYEPQHSRGTGIDRPLAELIIAVTTALDAYSRVRSEKLDEGSFKETQVPNKEIDGIRVAVGKSEALSTQLSKASTELFAHFPDDKEAAEKLGRGIADADNINILARAELRDKIVIRWYRKIVAALSITPAKLRGLAKALTFVKGGAQIWDKYQSKVFNATIEAIEDVTVSLEEVATKIEERSSAGKAPSSDIFDLDEVIRIILSGRQVSSGASRYVTSLDLKGYDHRNTYPFENLYNLQILKISGVRPVDLSGLSELRKITSLQLNINGPDGSALSPLVNMKHLAITQPISSIALVRNMSQLSSLKIATDDVQDWSPLAALGNLKSLNISCRKGYVDLESLTGLSSLEDLVIWGGNLKSMHGISKLKNLRSIELRRTTGLDLSHVLEVELLKKLKLKQASPIKSTDLVTLRKKGVQVLVG